MRGWVTGDGGRGENREEEEREKIIGERNRMEEERGGDEGAEIRQGIK